MAVNKNFVVKNGIEVNDDLIITDVGNKNVGIATTIPSYRLDVRGSIGATDTYTSGVSTVFTEFNVGTGGTVFTVVGQTGTGQSVGIRTANPAYLLDVRGPVSVGQTSLYVQGDTTITGNLNVTGDIAYDEVTGRNIYISGLSTFVGMSTFKNDMYVAGVSTFTGIGTFASDLYVGGNLNVTGDLVYDEVTGRNIYISGLSTFVGFSTFKNDVYVAGVVTATKFYGDGSELTNVDASTGGTLGIQSGTTYIGSGMTTLTITGGNSQVSEVSSGFSTITLPVAGVSLGLAIALGG